MSVGLISFKGLPVYAIQLANALCDFTELHFFLADNVMRKYANLIDARANKHSISVRRYRDPRSLLVALNLIRKLKKEKCSVAHLILNEPWFNLCIPFIRSVPLLTTVHDVEYHPGDKRSSVVPQIVTDMATRYSSGLIVHTEGLRRGVCRRFNRNPDYTFVIPHMNYSFYRHWEREDVLESENNILFFGSIWEYKGIRYLMEAEPILSRHLQKFRITIAGTGEDFSKYTAYTKGSSHYEIINEFIPDEKVAQLFQKASVVVLPYIEASQSGVVPLAFSFGKPVIATAVGGIPDLVNDGVDGFIVPPKDPVKLAEAIIAVLQSPERKAAMSRSAREKAYGELGLSRIGKLHISAYEKCLAKFSGSNTREL